MKNSKNYYGHPMKTDGDLKGILQSPSSRKQYYTITIWVRGTETAESMVSWSGDRRTIVSMWDAWK